MLQQPNARAKLATVAPDFDDTAFFGAIEARRQAENLSWRQLGRKLALSPSTFSRMARGRRPDVETFLRLLAWLDLPAQAFMKGLTDSTKQANQNTLAVIATALHTDPMIPTGGAGALEQLLRVAYARLTASQQGTPTRAVKSKRSRVRR